MDIESWMGDIRRHVDAILERFFESKCEEATWLSPQAIELVNEVRELTMRGGKRLRPIVTAAAYRAASGATDLSPTFEVGAALELLQTYLLIHDDWMDEDNERRGGPAVHYAFQERHGHDHLGASLGILAGDLASTFGWELILSGSFPESRRDEGLALFVRIQKEVFAGQQLDLMADGDVERMHDLKTGSYTTRGPAELGGILADADEASTGKPGDDLRHGKHNAVVAAFGRLAPSAADRAVLEGVWGHADATDEEVLAATEVLSAAKREVGTRLGFLADEARSALGASPFDEEAKQVLEEVTRRLTDRGA